MIDAIEWGIAAYIFIGAVVAYAVPYPAGEMPTLCDFVLWSLVVNLT